GYWLWRDAGGALSFAAPRTTARHAPAAATPRRRSAPGPGWEAAALGVLLAVAAAAAFGALQSLPLGRGSAMGRGLMPLALSFLLLGLGVIVAVEGYIRRPAVQRASLWPPFAVLAAVAAFALAIKPFGLLAATGLAAAITAAYALRGRYAGM